MKPFVCASLSALFCLSAAAGADDFEAALDVGAWAGCVEQAGYTPYPIELLAADDGTFSVEYDGHCIGVHSPSSSTLYDADERIEIGADICIPTIKVIYDHQPGLLRLTFIDRNALNSVAALTPATSNASPDCAPKDLTS
jgi:hypothetical protein